MIVDDLPRGPRISRSTMAASDLWTGLRAANAPMLESVYRPKEMMARTADQADHPNRVIPLVRMVRGPDH